MAAAGIGDAALEQLRDQLYAVAEFAVREHERELASAAGFNALPPAERAEIEERAAILEYDANLTRSTAVRRAAEFQGVAERNRRGKTH